MNQNFSVWVLYGSKAQKLNTKHNKRHRINSLFMRCFSFKVTGYSPVRGNVRIAYKRVMESEASRNLLGGNAADTPTGLPTIPRRFGILLTQNGPFQVPSTFQSEKLRSSILRYYSLIFWSTESGEIRTEI